MWREEKQYPFFYTYFLYSVCIFCLFLNVFFCQHNYFLAERSESQNKRLWIANFWIPSMAEIKISTWMTPPSLRSSHFLKATPVQPLRKNTRTSEIGNKEHFCARGGSLPAREAPEHSSRALHSPCNGAGLLLLPPPTRPSSGHQLCRKQSHKTAQGHAPHRTSLSQARSGACQHSIGGRRTTAAVPGPHVGWGISIPPWIVQTSPLSDAAPSSSCLCTDPAASPSAPKHHP